MAILRCVILCYIVFLVGGNTIGQTTSIDSLLRAIDLERSDSAKLILLMDISEELMPINPDSAIHYLGKAKAIAKGKESQSNWFTLQLALITRNIGNGYYFKSDFNSAIAHYIEASNFLKVYIGNSSDSLANEARVNAAGIMVNKGIIYSITGDYEKAMEAYLNALHEYELTGNKKGMASCYLGIGNLEFHLKDFDKAIISLKRAEELYSALNNYSGMASCSNTIGSIYFMKKEYEKSLEYYQKTKGYREKLGDRRGVSTALTNIANVYIEIENFDDALDHLNRALEIDTSLGDTYGAAIVKLNIARLYDRIATGAKMPRMSRKKHFETASALAEEAYRSAKELNVLPLKEASAELLAHIYRSLERYDDARQYQSISKATRDSIFNEDKTKALAEMQARFETEKKQLQIDALTKESTLREEVIRRKERESRKQRLLIFTFLAAFVLVFILSTFLYNLVLHKKRANEQLQEQQQQIIFQNTNLLQANEEIMVQRDEITAQRDMVISQKTMLETAHHKLTDSLSYAQSIQGAILPSEKTLNRISPNSFVWTRPCELVSGDFHWATLFDDYQIFCVADCTGHGVPGAFMSILGVTTLNDVVNRHRISKPSEILNQMRESLIEAISQNNPHQLHKDGMDLAVCTFNTKTQELQYAGAGIPLWVVTNRKPNVSFEPSRAIVSASGSMLFEVKGDNMPVGQSIRQRPFTNHSFNVKDTDVSIYLATDGFADQVGKIGKFGKKGLKEKILSISKYQFPEQLRILDRTFDTWKNSSIQIDDATILGIQLKTG